VKKSPFIALICIIVAIGLSFLTLASINRNESYGHGDSHSSDLPYLQGVTKSNGYYNISLAFSNVADPVRIDNILINPQSQESITDTIFYLNGTTVDAADPVRCNLKSGDSLQINLTLPCTKHASGSTITLCVIGNPIGYNTEVVLP
jgi:hypothetical protein